ncbi:MAG TPA: alpha/beta hydrolase [Ilumatobacteraceae bacterium]|nr:alpha/beta hydrolase [Ilumatobacteraceae bacterium]
MPVATIRLEGLDGIVLAADVAGDPADAVVILLHGGGQTRHAWGGALSALAGTGWYVVSLDLRGHGESEWSPDGVYDMDRFAGDIEAVARQFRAPVLVGASLGGMSALIAIGESPSPFASGLVLVDVVPTLEAVGVARITDFMALGVEGFDSLEAVADAVASYLPQRKRPTDISGLRKNVRQRADGKWVWHWDPAFFSRLGQGEFNGEPTAGQVAPSDRLARAARSVIVPTLLVRGGASDVVSPEGARELQEMIPHAHAVDVAGAGHMVAGDRNDRFNGAVIDFLDTVIRPTL